MTRKTYTLLGQVQAFRVVGGPDAGLYHVQTDHLGSVALTSIGWTKQGSIRQFYPFGEHRSGSSSLAATDRGFTGHMENRDIGLTYMNARFYVPAANHFASADSIVPNPMDPQTYNRYSYVYNRPLIIIDPSGHMGCFTDFAGSCGNTNAGPILDGPIDWEAPATFGQYTPVGGTIDDIMTAATGCGFVCKAGSEEPVGAFWRGVSGAAIIAPVNGAVVRNTAQGIATFFKRNGDEILQFANRLRKGCAFNSFEAGTMVETIDGPKPIEEIDVGDVVLAYNEATGEIGYYPVTDLISHLDLQVVYLIIDGETIVTTAEHPFFTADGEWVDAGELQAGDAIRTSNWTTGKVTWAQTVAQPQQMYNFTVATAHTYFVGDGEWLVHNINCPSLDNIIWPADMVVKGKLPVATFGKEYIGWGTGVGGVNDLIATLDDPIGGAQYIQGLIDKGVTSDQALGVADWYASQTKRGGTTAPARADLMYEIAALLDEQGR